MLIKIFVVLMLVAIFVSLFSALVFLLRNRGQSTRTAQALAWRIGLSLTLLSCSRRDLLRDHPTEGRNP